MRLNSKVICICVACASWTAFWAGSIAWEMKGQVTVYGQDIYRSSFSLVVDIYVCVMTFYSLLPRSREGWAVWCFGPGLQACSKGIFL